MFNTPSTGDRVAFHNAARDTWLMREARVSRGRSERRDWLVLDT